MQKWEYKVLRRRRAMKAGKTEDDAYEGTPWHTNADNEDLGYPDILEILAKLGQEGWELVAAWPRSDLSGGMHERGTGRAIGGSVSVSYDYAGFATTEWWVFKRPVES